MIKNIKTPTDWINYLNKTAEEKLEAGLFIGETITLLENPELLQITKNKGYAEKCVEKAYFE